MKLRLSLVTLAALLAASVACAQGFKPARTVDLVVHTGPGGGSDVLARAIAVMVEKEKLLPVRLQVINKPGGNGAVAAAHLAEKKGDPNTLGLFTGVWLQSPLVSAEAKVTLRDLTPIARLVLEPAVIAVKADAPYKTLADFIDAAKKAFISFPGGGERIAALLGGHVNIMVIEPEEAGEHIRAGNLRVLAQVSEKRLAKFPEVPTLKEAGFDVPVVPQVRGVVAPPGIPKENVEFWQDFFRRLTRTPSWQKYIADNQFEDGYQNAADLAKFYDEFTDRMREILKDAGVKTVR